MIDVNRTIKYIKDSGYNPYSDNKLSKSDIFYINTLEDHYSMLANEIQSVLKDNTINSILELGSYMAVGSHLARDAGVKNITCASCGFCSFVFFVRSRIYIYLKRNIISSHFIFLLMHLMLL